MEIIFGLISLVIPILVIYSTGRMVFSHKELIKIYEDEEWLVMIHVLLGLMMALIIFIALCAINNTFWCIPYMFK